MTGPRNAQRGFSALEALVAVAILGLGLAGLLGWRQGLARQHARIATIESNATAQANALSLLRDINPMATPSGTAELAPGEAVSWRATPLTDARRSVAYPAGDGDFDVALYRVDATVQRATQPPLAFSFEALGWTAHGVRAEGAQPAP